MAKGGFRAGSGRKKGVATIEREKMKDYVAQRIANVGNKLVTVLIEKALTGDVPAIKELFDRGFGKPAQAVDVTTQGESLKIDDNQYKQLIGTARARTDNS